MWMEAKRGETEEATTHATVEVLMREPTHIKVPGGDLGAGELRRWGWGSSAQRASPPYSVPRHACSPISLHIKAYAGLIICKSAALKPDSYFWHQTCSRLISLFINDR
jgi:hypothetical protein